MPDFTRKLERALAADDVVKIAESKTLDVIMGIPKWIVLGYLLYQLEKDGGRWKGDALPGRSVKLAKNLAELE